MENVCDDVLYSILGRLPGKPLLRLRCVSNRWNALISDPYFMKSRSRRMILLPYTRPLVAIDEKVPVKDKAHSMVGIHYPLEKSMVVSIVGTFNGIVLLALTDFYKSLRCELVLYNPLTCASNKLLVMDPLYQTSFVFGFADLKIVRFEVFNDSMYRCDAFDLKTSSWSSRPLYLIRDFRFGGDAVIKCRIWSFEAKMQGACNGSLKSGTENMLRHHVPGEYDARASHANVDGHRFVSPRSLLVSSFLPISFSAPFHLSFSDKHTASVQMAEMMGKIVQNLPSAQCCQQNRQFGSLYQRDQYAQFKNNLLLFQGRKLTWTGISAMRLHNMSNISQRVVYCNASPSATAAPSLGKVDFLKLQNGSDIRGVAVDGVAGEPVNLTEPVTEAIAAAFAAWLLDKKKADSSKRLKISIGHDSRISAQRLQDAASRGIAGADFDVVQYGLASTPAMFNSTLTKNEDILCPVDGAIMITASHLPYNRNGLKFFTNAGGLGKADIKDILERAANIYNSFTPESLKEAERKASSSISKVDYMTVYASDLVAAVRKASGNIEKPLEGFHIIVDAGNGAGGFFAGKVLEPLGAITSGSQFLEPDGLFPNHIPNPEDKTAMKAITQAVIDNKADLGIIFDTDVDRSAAVDSTGHSVTSDGLTTFIEKKLGGKHHRFKRGYKNVIDEAIRLNSVGEESHLAIETSGHGALKENHWLDDGAYLMVKLLNKLASARASGQTGGSKVLTDLVNELQEPGVAVELRLKIDQNHSDLKGGSFREYGEAVLKHLENKSESDPKLQKAPVNYEGVRVSGFGGWFLLRLSLHDPVLPLNIEAPSNEEAVTLGLAVLSAVNEFSALDVSALAKFVQQ
ncbi:hypothetical protein L1987_35015 [Smallanthus sonchifolius]|uniref:Uncharacterized protein n=1 Tax=Smallanthus sonchifolius TaxID=185202 RepID=A0ACB9HW79_9ASTR|nr:hypothetical protein L1987_35015 [Smallanthus sonchifolius]